MLNKKTPEVCFKQLQEFDYYVLIVCLPFKEMRNKFLETAAPGEPLMMSAW